jgi:putative DNA primase/helicase
MFARDTSFLARLMSGNMDEDRAALDIPGLSPIFQPVARRLLTALPRDRPPIWDDFLAGRLRPDPIIPHSATGRLIEPPRRVRLTCAVDVEPCAVDWLWSGRVPLGMITMFAGDPKLGKSYVTLAMAAALSRGLPLPMSDRPNHPGSTILMSAEDDPARTIVPRLVSGGADLTKVHILESVFHENGAEALPSLRADIDAITAAAARLGDCRLIVIDPVSAYLQGVDDNRNATLRSVLTPLNRLAERLGAAVVLVSHLTKTGSANRKHRVLGSIAYIGACRANHLFIADPDDPAGRRVLMLDNGGNVAPPAPALAYMIGDRENGPRIEWCHEPVSSAIVTSLEPAQRAQRHHEGQAARHHVCDHWLRAFLAERRRSTTEILEAASEAGFTKDQVRRAKSRIGAVAKRAGFDKDAQWSWRLPVGPSSR